MDAITSPEGALRLAITVLLAVVGYRVARPTRGRDWVAVLAYVGALAAVLVGERAAPAAPPHLAVRALGALLLLAGLLVAGAAVRAARRAFPPAPPAPRAAGRPAPRPPALVVAPGDRPVVHAGLALVLAGQFLRAPTQLGAMAVAAAVLVLAATGWAGARRR